MNWLAFTETVVTLFVIVDPLGTVPVFVALTAERTPGQRRWAAVQSAAVAGLLIAVFALFGRLSSTTSMSLSRASKSPAACYFCLSRSTCFAATVPW
jgi:small neutral amino acid transporter SnatA (MarC family)